MTGPQQRTTAKPDSKLTEDQAYQIKFFETGSRVKIAKKYGVSHSTVSYIQWGKAWSWLQLKPEHQHLALPRGVNVKGKRKRTTVLIDD